MILFTLPYRDSFIATTYAGALKFYRTHGHRQGFSYTRIR